jgi:hypothetical protein
LELLLDPDVAEILFVFLSSSHLESISLVSSNAPDLLSLCVELTLDPDLRLCASWEFLWESYLYDSVFLHTKFTNIHKWRKSKKEFKSLTFAHKLTKRKTETVLHVLF